MMHDNNYCDPIVGNSLDLDLDDCSCEIRADIIVEKTSPSVRLWGQIKDCSGCPVPNALIKLVRVCNCHGYAKYEGIAHTISDCYGFYQFDLCSNDCRGNSYKVIVGKSVTSAEKVVHSSGNCDVCNNDSYSPCDDQYCCSNSDYGFGKTHYPISTNRPSNSFNYCEHDIDNKSFTTYFRHSNNIDKNEECYTIEYLNYSPFNFQSKKESRLGGYFI